MATARRTRRARSSRSRRRSRPRSRSRPRKPQQSAPGQVKKEPTAATPGCSKPRRDRRRRAAARRARRTALNSTQAGKKPSNSTTKWTHCVAGGGLGANAACTGVLGTPNDKPDVSKRYGNGKTAVQIANGRGAPAGTMLTGPGNSQPHKVTACGKPNNKSGGVDVHAVKSYDNSKCQPAASTQQPSVTESRVCGAVITAANTQQVVRRVARQARAPDDEPESRRTSRSTPTRRSPSSRA